MKLKDVKQYKKTKDDGTVKVVSVPPERTVQSFVCLWYSTVRIRVGLEGGKTFGLGLSCFLSCLVRCCQVPKKPRLACVRY